ncbi:MAG: universal stress protein, partial [Pseudomonadota bacterium]
MKKRRSFEAGHRRKFLLVVDGSDEVEAAIFYAANRV